MTPNFLSVIKNRNSQIQEAQQNSSKVNVKKATSKYVIIIMKLLKTRDKEKIWKSNQRKRHP